MKKIIFILLSVFAAFACTNQDIEFPDFDYNAVYYPLQYPVRTLILGEDRIDNSLDKELKFNIGAVIGGMYGNSMDRHIDYVVDNSLAENLLTSSGDTIRALPSSYYTISPSGTFVIPSGSLRGGVEVQLTNAFLDDSLSITGNYVIPLRITGADTDSILSGLPNYGVISPNKHVASDWDAGAPPKDFVLYAIKYINPYHGTYFHRGVDTKYDLDGVTPLETKVYHERYVEYDQLWKITTTGKMTATTNGLGWKPGVANAMKLVISDNGDITIENMPGSPYNVAGTGKYVEDGDSWGGKAQNAMFLDYQYTEDGYTRKAVDTLVFRNNGVVFEEHKVTVIP